MSSRSSRAHLDIARQLKELEVEARTIENLSELVSLANVHVEEHLSRLNADVKDLKADVKDIKTTLRSMEPLLSRLDQKLDSKPSFGAMLSVMLAMFALVIGAIVAGMTLMSVG